MLLTPREQEKLIIYVVADLARKRRGRGLKLNVADGTALIAEALPNGSALLIRSLGEAPSAVHARLRQLWSRMSQSLVYPAWPC